MTYKNIIKLSESLLLQYEDGYLFTFKLKYSFDNNTRIAIEFLKETIAFVLYNEYDCQISETLSVHKIKDRKDICKILNKENIRKQIFKYNEDEYIIELEI